MNYIETERLILRDWQEKDLQYFIAINQDPEVMRYSAKILNEHETRKYYNQIIYNFDYHKFGLYAVELKESKQFIGYIGLTLPPHDFWPDFVPYVEIGWRLGLKHWNKGYATEGAKACIDHGFHKLHLKEMISMTRKNNLASIRVMEKIGMKRDNVSNINHFSSDYLLYRI